MDSLSQLEDLLHRLLQFDSEGTVSRIDLAVDFVTDQKIEPWSRDSWISRLREFKCNWIGDRFTGWQLGTKQNSVSGGLYDKSFEVSQVSGKAYLYEIWAAAGHIPWDDVWRLEGRFRREYLRSVGLTTLPHVLSCLGALWVYFTNDLIRLAVVTESDSTRARWPTMALWEALSGVDWNTPATALKRHVRPHRAPSNTYFARIGRALLTSKMARDNQSEPAEAWRDLLAIVEDYLRHQEELSGVSAERTIADIAANKARKYFIRRHAAPGTPAPLTDTAAVRAYREASRGT